MLDSYDVNGGNDVNDENDEIDDAKNHFWRRHNLNYLSIFT